MNQDNPIVYVTNCPRCSHNSSQAYKSEEALNTSRNKCSKCGYEDLAKNFEIKKMSFEEWIGPQYSNSGDSISMAEFNQMYEQEIKSGKTPLDEIIKVKDKDDEEK